MCPRTPAAVVVSLSLALSIHGDLQKDVTPPPVVHGEEYSSSILLGRWMLKCSSESTSAAFRFSLWQRQFHMAQISCRYRMRRRGSASFVLRIYRNSQLCGAFTQPLFCCPCVCQYHHSQTCKLSPVCFTVSAQED